MDHRRRQNVVRTSVTHSATPGVALFCFYHFLTSSVIYYWTDARRQHGIYLFSSYLILTSYKIYYWIDARQHGIYLFYIITKQTTTDKTFFYFRIFRHNSKPAFAHLDENEKAIWRNWLSIQNEAISSVGMHRIVIGPRKSRHCQTWLEYHFSWNENL